MARPPKPRFREDKNAWYGQVGGVRYMLARGRKNHAAARSRLAELVRGDGAQLATGPVVGEIAERRLDWLEQNRSPRTLKDAARFLQPFVMPALPYGRMLATELRPYHVEDWLRQQTGWGSQTRHHAATVIKSMFSWAAKHGLIASSPVAELSSPGGPRRPLCVGERELALILPWIRSDEFRELVLVLSATGARPDEIARLEARHLRPDTQTASMEGKTTAKTKRLRDIWFTPQAWAIVARRAKERPSGLLFRTRAGSRWSDNARKNQIARIRARFDAARAALPKAEQKGMVLPEFDSYSFRHGFVTDALERGLTASEVAALVGNSAEVIEKTYDHLRQRQPAMRGMLERAKPSR